MTVTSSQILEEPGQLPGATWGGVRRQMNPTTHLQRGPKNMLNYTTGMPSTKSRLGDATGQTSWFLQQTKLLRKNKKMEGKLD